MMDAGRHPKIELLSYSEVDDVSGYVGQFHVRVRRKPRYVSEEACTGCMACKEKCPKRVVDDGYDAGLGRRKAIYRTFAQATPPYAVIDRDNCLYFAKGRCRLCEEVCPTGAIDFEQEEEIVEFDVGAIVVATGFQMWDATLLPQYSYGRSPNIVTALQFERLTSVNGPTSGEIVTSEGKKPENVAIIHCVGSRDEHAHSYCSRFCCMYSLKQAHQIREKTGAEVYEFYMDMRAFGKAYEEFYERVQEDGVTFVRGRGAEVEVLPDGKLRVKGEDADLGRVVVADVDLVVLATAVEPQADSTRLAPLFGLGRTPDGFFAEAHPKMRPVDTTRDGIYLAGCCQGPKDIPDTVAQAKAAASSAIVILRQQKAKLETQNAKPETQTGVLDGSFR